MSQFAGVFYFDSRTIRPEDRDSILRCASQSNAPPEVHSGPGLLLGYSGSAHESSGGFALSAAKGLACTFDGRIDNCSEPLTGGRQATPGELALAAYEAKGLDGLRDLIGDWSLALWDSRSRAISLASDYAGIRPLYYHRTHERLAWSTSLAHIAAWTGQTDLDEDYVADFLSRGSPLNCTPYRGIQPVPAGCAVQFSHDRTVTIPFWTVPVNQELRYRDEREYEENLRSIFEEAVAVRMNTGGPVCAELSGGLDSSSVVSMAHHLIQSGKTRATGLVAFCYRSAASMDEKYYRAVVQSWNISSVHLETDQFPPLTSACAGGAAPTLWSPRFLEVARRMQQVKSSVLLTGRLGDLVMGNWLDDSEQAADLVRQGRVLKAVREAFAWSHSLEIPVYSILWRAIRSNFTGNPHRTAASRDEHSGSLAAGLARRARQRERERSKPLWTRDRSVARRKRMNALYEAFQGRTLECPEPLQEVSQSHPFLHRPLVEFMLAIPCSIVCRPREPRRLMRRTLAGILPEIVLRRRSKGSYADAFMEALRPCAAEMLRDLNAVRLVQLGYLDRGSFERRLTRLLSGLECNEPQLRRIILLELWLRCRSRRAE